MTDILVTDSTTGTLPDGYAALDFDAARGLPQQARYTIEGCTYTFVLAATVPDFVALIAAEASTAVVEIAAAASVGLAAPDTIEADTRAARWPAATPWTEAAPDALAAEVIRPYLLVTEGGAVVASQPVRTGVALTIGPADADAYALDVWVAACDLRAGSFVRSGQVGASLLVGVRAREDGALPTTVAGAGAGADEEDAYAALT